MKQEVDPKGDSSAIVRIKRLVLDRVSALDWLGCSGTSTPPLQVLRRNSLTPHLHRSRLSRISNASKAHHTNIWESCKLAVVGLPKLARWRPTQSLWHLLQARYSVMHASRSLTQKKRGDQGLSATCIWAHTVQTHTVHNVQSPYFEGAESISGLGLPQFQPFRGSGPKT